MSPKRFIQIDLEGQFMFSTLRIQDEILGASLLKNLFVREFGFFTKSEGHEVYVEAFDQPFVVQQIHKEGKNWSLQMPYHHRENLNIESLVLDEWDRFLGHTDKGIPFVFSRQAQAEFFRLLNDYDDTGIVIDGKRIEVPLLYPENPQVKSEKFWSDIYEAEENPGWDLGEATPVLKDALNQLKLNKLRILVLGAGAGHDAALLADKGHLVTAVDFSLSAEQLFRQRYPYIKNMNYVVGDVFDVCREFNESFDMVFDHTFYCAIPPRRRAELAKLWRSVLVPGGHLFGIFYVMDKLVGPPWGASEWEIHQRLNKKFDFLYWTRVKNSIPRRLGKELLVYATKK